MISLERCRKVPASVFRHYFSVWKGHNEGHYQAMSVFVERYSDNNSGCILLRVSGVPYGSRTRVAAVKEKGPMVIQRNLAAWIALYRT